MCNCALVGNALHRANPKCTEERNIGVAESPLKYILGTAQNPVSKKSQKTTEWSKENWKIKINFTTKVIWKAVRKLASLIYVTENEICVSMKDYKSVGIKEAIY